MKASVKFREERKPLFRAKLPLNILGFPFQSGVVAGESKELSLNLSTCLESGPSLKVAYRPSDSLNPFSLVFKTGTGHLGSPIASSLNMKVEYNLSGGGKKLSFSLHFKPHLGDFIVKNVQSSVFKKQITGDAPIIVDLCKKFSNSPFQSPAVGLVKGVLSEVEMTATTAVPLRKNASFTFRWGVRLPVPMKMISFQKLPFLLINKIRIDGKDSSQVGPAPIEAEAFLGVKKQLEIIQAENRAFKEAMHELKGGIFKELEITEAEHGALKNAVDYLKDEFEYHIVGDQM